MPAVAIVHYHLRAGGVTKVIESACRCLEERQVPYVVLTGSPADSIPGVKAVHIPELGYASDLDQIPKATDLLETLRHACHEALGKTPVLWHFHNHALGKNRAVSKVVSLLAEAGEALVLQEHDFAEDGRPSNYSNIREIDRLYPYAPRIRYAFLNQRDYDFLVEAGLPEDRGQVLPNAVSPPTVPGGSARSNGHLVVYPVRGVRRKNLGEICLLSAIAPENTRFAVCLRPENPEWLEIHDKWVDFAAAQKLGIDFAVVGNQSPSPELDHSYASWLTEATHIITTSVAEGFGMAFLEPKLLGKPLIGRDLPEITCDFRAQGVEPDHLYSAILIPIDWVGHERLQQILSQAVRHTLEAYDLDMSASYLHKVSDILIQDEHIDFANLPETEQQDIIKKIVSEDRGHEVLIKIDDSLKSADNWLTRRLTHQHHGESCREALRLYSEDSYAERLIDIYTQVSGSTAEPPQFVAPHRVLNRFLKPQNFHFLRSAYPKWEEE